MKVSSGEDEDISGLFYDAEILKVSLTLVNECDVYIESKCMSCK